MTLSLARAAIQVEQWEDGWLWIKGLRPQSQGARGPLALGPEAAFGSVRSGTCLHVRPRWGAHFLVGRLALGDEMADPQSNQGIPRAPTLAWDPDRMRFVGRATLRVRYAESDRMGIAYNGHYLTWFEISRTELMRSACVPYRTVEERGYNLPLVDAHLRLRSSVGYDDILTTETWIEEIRSRTVTFGYRILHEGRAVAHGQTTHVCVRASDGRGANLPAWLKQRIRELISRK